VDVEFDPAKDAENQRKHRISLQRAAEFDLASSKLDVDDREDYGEARFIALVFLNAVLYSLTFTPRDGRLRAISLRKATGRERNE
jgi:uncharacterized DUF497 family protein